MPVFQEKIRLPGLAVRVGWFVTFRVTGMVAGLPLAPAEVTVTVPVNVPAVVNPAVLIPMLRLLGTVPPVAGDAVSQVWLVEEVKAIPDVPEILTDCAVGVLPANV